jgi:hypothetical protein
MIKLNQQSKYDMDVDLYPRGKASDSISSRTGRGKHVPVTVVVTGRRHRPCMHAMRVTIHRTTRDARISTKSS